MTRLLYLPIVLLLTLPWLNPFAPGPSPSVAPWLLAMVCVAGALCLYAVGGNTRIHVGAPQAPDWQTLLGASLLAAGLASCVLALLQYFDLEALSPRWINPTEPGYAFANLRQRNQFASLTNLALGVLLAWAMRPANGQINGQINGQMNGPMNEQINAQMVRQVGGVALAATALLAVGNAASSSRTGAVQIIVLCALFGLWGGWRIGWVRLILTTAVAVYVAAAVALPLAAGFDWSAHGLFARLQAGDELCSSRTTLWSNVLHLTTQKPWLGWGWGELDYAHFITLYDGPRFCDILDNAHNLPLHLAVELGVPVALLVCGGFAWWAIRQKPWAERDTARQMAWAVLAVILLHSMLEYPLWYGPFQIAFVLCLLILWRRPMKVANTKNDANYGLNTPLAQVNSAQRAIITIASVVGLTAIAYTAWDYHRVSQIYLQPEARHAAYQVDTLAQARKSWLFADQALFAELILTPLTPATAVQVYASAGYLLHYSPEPRVVQKLIESAVMLGQDADALAYLARFKAAFPKEHATWAEKLVGTP